MGIADDQRHICIPRYCHSLAELTRVEQQCPDIGDGMRMLATVVIVANVCIYVLPGSGGFVPCCMPISREGSLHTSSVFTGCT